jgi:hypothetical protein
MAIHSEPHTVDWFLRDPRKGKWIVQCVGCQQIGYRADAPEEFFDRQRITYQLRPLSVDERGLCPECVEAESHIKSGEQSTPTI